MKFFSHDYRFPDRTFASACTKHYVDPILSHTGHWNFLPFCAEDTNNVMPRTLDSHDQVALTIDCTGFSQEICKWLNLDHSRGIVRMALRAASQLIIEVWTRFKYPINEFLKAKKYRVLKAKKYHALKEEKYSPGNTRELSFIHIGKCGGTTLEHAIKVSPILRDRFDRTKHIHVRKPHYQPNARYIIVVRNPIERTISAFNYCLHRVVESRQEEFHRSGEFEVLEKYGTIDTLAKALYDDRDELSVQAVEDWELVHHLKADISFYLKPLLGRLQPEQLFAVFSQENLDNDIKNHLGITSVPRRYERRSKTRPEALQLSKRGRANLKRFLADEYECIRRLSELSHIPPDVLDKLLE